MKRTWQLVSLLSICIFAVLFITSKFIDTANLIIFQHQEIFVLIYLFTSLKYYQQKLKEKDIEIEALKGKQTKTI